MAAMDKYKDLNRAETAQMIYNAYFNDGEVDPGPGPVEQTTFEGVYAITGIKDGSVEIADLVAADKGAKVDPVEMVTVTTIQWSLANKRTIDFDAGATIKTAKGKLINGEDFKDAKASDIVASTDAKYYAAKVNVKDNKVTSIEYYSTGFEPLYKQQSNGYLAKPCERSVYYSAVESVTEFALGTEGEWKSGIDGDLVSYTQPKYGSVAPVPQTATMWKFRLNYTLPANTAKIGDVYTFTWTCQTKDKSIESTAVVTISITPATIVPAKAITAKVGESTKIEKDYLYEGVQFAKGASIGKSSYVIYDDVNKKEYDWKSKDPFITSLGGKLTRLGEDIFTYEPAAGTAGKSEIFYLALHDGMGVVIVPVTVTIS